nr:MAG TPA: hypothetical protein [Caudoviricetes sp.]
MRKEFLFFINSFIEIIILVLSLSGDFYFSMILILLKNFINSLFD